MYLSLFAWHEMLSSVVSSVATDMHTQPWLSNQADRYQRRHYYQKESYRLFIDQWQFGSPTGWVNIVMTPDSSCHSSDSEETTDNKKKYWELAHKYFHRWRHNTAHQIARRRKVALRKVSSMLQKLMRRAMFSPEVLHMIAEFLARRSPLRRNR